MLQGLARQWIWYEMRDSWQQWHQNMGALFDFNALAGLSDLGSLVNPSNFMPKS